MDLCRLYAKRLIGYASQLDAAYGVKLVLSVAIRNKNGQ
jgi:hypothetical protein